MYVCMYVCMYQRTKLHTYVQYVYIGNNINIYSYIDDIV